jgi:hypothetical protein
LCKRETATSERHLTNHEPRARSTFRIASSCWEECEPRRAAQRWLTGKNRSHYGLACERDGRSRRPAAGARRVDVHASSRGRRRKGRAKADAGCCHAERTGALAMARASRRAAVRAGMTVGPTGGPVGGLTGRSLRQGGRLSATGAAQRRVHVALRLDSATSPPWRAAWGPRTAPPRSLPSPPGVPNGRAGQGRYSRRWPPAALR